MKKTITILIAGLICSASANTYAAEGNCVIETKVNGLICDFCVRALNKVFKKEETVDKLDVNLDNGKVAIFMKDSKALSDDTVKDYITEAGYSLVSISKNNCE